MYYLRDYTEGHKTASGTSVDDAKISRMFSELRKEDVHLFFKEWMQIKKAKEYVSYAVTSISSYGKGMKELE